MSTSTIITTTTITPTITDPGWMAQGPGKLELITACPPAARMAAFIPRQGGARICASLAER